MVFLSSNQTMIQIILGVIIVSIGIFVFYKYPMKSDVRQMTLGSNTPGHRIAQHDRIDSRIHPAGTEQPYNAQRTDTSTGKDHWYQNFSGSAQCPGKNADDHINKIRRQHKAAHMYTDSHHCTVCRK